jgi:GTP pyrophosphokinase
VDGALVPLNRPLTNGQTVEVVAARDGGPSMDWLNPELGYLHSPRSRAKVRAWFNAQAQAQTVARGRESVEKLLQREGKTAIGHEDLAHRLGFKSADALFEVVGKDEMSLRQIEALLRPAAEAPTPEPVVLKRSRASAGGVLVVGIDSLMTSLARCCRPAPPDSIGGFVTRGKGVAVHRAQCSNFRHMAAVSPDRIIPVTWGDMPATSTSSAAKASAGRVERLYPLDVRIEASDRQGLLRDISEVFARERVNVTGVQTRSVKEASGSTAHMTFTVELADATRLRQVLGEVASVSGVRSARRL